VAVSVVSLGDVFGHERIYVAGQPARRRRRFRVTARFLITTAVVALVVAIGYDKYKQRQGN
jgi:hypothetical protein